MRMDMTKAGRDDNFIRFGRTSETGEPGLGFSEAEGKRQLSLRRAENGPPLFLPP